MTLRTADRTKRERRLDPAGAARVRSPNRVPATAAEIGNTIWPICNELRIWCSASEGGACSAVLRSAATSSECAEAKVSRGDRQAQRGRRERDQLEQPRRHHFFREMRLRYIPVLIGKR